MGDIDPRLDHEVVEHFTARAAHYDRSSSWCTDQDLLGTVVRLLDPQPHHQALDVACGTGLVSQAFKGRVAKVTGADITSAMFELARERLDEMVVAPGEDLPFADGTFDLVFSRQGTQFMRDAEAVSEMVRVAKPGGRIAIINLCAYSEADRDEYFEILRLRNPARRNFYMREDLDRLLRDAGCSEVAVHDYVSREDVDTWSDNKAIPESRREAIRACYRDASDAFSALHATELADGRIVDHMLFGIAVGVK